MPGNIEFDLLGASEMEKTLKELGPRAATKSGDKALRKGARVIQKAAKDKVPVKTGELKKSIVVRMDTRGNRSSGGRFSEGERTIFIGFKPPTSRRAHLTEFGTFNQPAQPFLRPAINNNHRRALNEMGKELADGITAAAEELANPNPTRK